MKCIVLLVFLSMLSLNMAAPQREVSVKKTEISVQKKFDRMAAPRQDRWVGGMIGPVGHPRDGRFGGVIGPIGHSRRDGLPPILPGSSGMGRDRRDGLPRILPGSPMVTMDRVGMNEPGGSKVFREVHKKKRVIDQASGKISEKTVDARSVRIKNH
ncbi:unnamed protein product [Cylicocyclus nassatus]|uniref:Uncharacterized protein n=1 Tax=Cylicocyclus nassatus TaxID=53992 RepID=A0AA36DJA4_CYLNA|nr:unnamed protein product [Cylicocyclus nassatus]